MMERMISRGPMTIILVFSPSCPHCHTYMPLWKKLERQRARKANMISVRADIYDKTPLSERKPVSSVPTVLFVDKEGQISEAEEPRNLPVMSNAVRTGSSEAEAALATTTQTNTRMNEKLTEEVRAAVAKRESEMPMSAPIRPVLPGTTVSENPLSAMPATPISEVSDEPMVNQMGGAYHQEGGSPWVAFLLAARQAAPAAALLGAHAALPHRRSSGLSAPSRPVHRRRVSFRRSR